MEYKNTIITPKTDFPMKAGLPLREPGMPVTAFECRIFRNKSGTAEVYQHLCLLM